VAEVKPVITGAELLQAQRLVREVAVSDPLLGYAAAIARATRPGPEADPFVREWVRWGAGPRAGQALVLAAKARAALHGRFATTLDDLRAAAAPVLRHRVLVNFRAEAEGIDADKVTARLLESVPEPKSPMK
jgi:MoxR-like ATPase